jgi:hypothetical protein
MGGQRSAPGDFERERGGPAFVSIDFAERLSKFIDFSSVSISR